MLCTDRCPTNPNQDGGVDVCVCCNKSNYFRLFLGKIIFNVKIGHICITSYIGMYSIYSITLE
jgi:hypothetical protein